MALAIGKLVKTVGVYKRGFLQYAVPNGKSDPEDTRIASVRCIGLSA
jgi:hypothetical protein